MAHCTAEAFNVVRCLDHSSKLDDSPQDKKQKGATALHRDKLHEQDFAGPISLRAFRILGPISRFRIAEILPTLTCVACFYGLCTAQRFHIEGEEQMCRIGCPDEPDSLPH